MLMRTGISWIVGLVMLLILLSVYNFEVISAQTFSTTQTMQPLLKVNLVYGFAEGNSATVVLNLTRLSDFGANSTTTLVDVYRIHIFSDGVLVASQGLGYFSNNNLPMGNGMADQNSIMGIVFAIPAVHSSMATPPDNVGQSSLESYNVVLDNSIGTNSSAPSNEGWWLTVEWIYSETFNQTIDQAYTPLNQTVAQVNLVSFSGGYLYNTVIPQDQLSQIDPANPMQYLQSLQTPTPTPSPTSQAPSSTLTNAPTEQQAKPTIKPSQTPASPEFPSTQSVAIVIIVGTMATLAYARKLLENKRQVKSIRPRTEQT
jgi:cell division septation protein DedD